MLLILGFQSIYRYFRKIGSNNHISAWKSKEFYDQSINPPTSDDSLGSHLIILALKQKKNLMEVSVNIYNVHAIDLWDGGNDFFPTKDTFFDVLKLAKKCWYW